MGCPGEETIVAFAEGRLPSETLARIENHALGCALCQDLLSVAVSTVAGSRGSGSMVGHTPPAPSESHTIDAAEGARVRLGAAVAEPAIERGTKVGRYTILERVGEGGFGEVFAAYDPELDRKIAIKFLRREGGASSVRAEARLLREAKAIARLTHANVVTVYDAGTFSERVFVAMEFVEGATLTDWLAARPRAQSEILAVFTQAARGLAAAHAAGLVHRDFKPANVMVRESGGVLVMDFGLVRQIADDPGARDGGGQESAAPVLSSEHELDLTRTGELVGTPAYMAPEQFKGERTDARTDQFSFCIALYRALYGAQPFGGEDVSALRANVLQGRVRPAPEGKSVPSWIRRVLLRGLAVAPAARFSTMAALLEALDDDPAARRRKWLTGAATVAVALALVLVVHRVGTRARTLCAGGSARLVGVWEPSGVSSPRKEAVRQAFARTGRAYATQAFARASQSLDAYADKWIAMDRDACEATRVRTEQPEGLLTLRTSCLADRRASLRALTDVFTLANAGVVQNAVSAVDGLPSIESCADLVALRAGAPTADPALQQRLEALRERYAHMQALAISGQCAQAVKEGEPLLNDLRTIGYRPLLAETLLISGQLGDSCVDPRTAIARSREAYDVAIAAHLDRLAARAADQIPPIAGNRLDDEQLASEWLEIARASYERAGRDDQLLGMLLTSEAFLASLRGDPERGVTFTREAYEAMRRALGPDHYMTLMGLGNIGEMLASAGHLEEGVAEDRRAIEAVSRVLGPTHPTIGIYFYNECEALNSLGRHAEARAECSRALDIWAQAGTDEAITNYGQTGLGIALDGLGRGEEAIAPLKVALRTRVSMNVTPHLIAETRFALARALWSRPADRVRAMELALRARADIARGGTPDDAKLRASIEGWLAKPGANAAKRSR